MRIKRVDRKTITLAGLIAAIIVPSELPAAAQQPAQKPPFQLLIEQQLGAQAVDMAILKAQNEQLQGLVAERDKTIAGLKAEMAEAKKEPPK